MTGSSLLLLDEIGRGTSTYDGISLAWAIATYLHEHPRHRPMTLFATHYHELNRMADKYSRIANYHVSVSRQGDRMEFLRTLQPGGSSHSFGLHVARMAGVPAAVIHEAETMLEHLESLRDESAKELSPKFTSNSNSSWQLSLWGDGDTQALALKESLMALESNNLTPMQALHWIMDQQSHIKGNDG
jgi:DNA mismatch repair protein MutS